MQALSEAAETLLQYLELAAADSAAADSPLTLAVIRSYARWARAAILGHIAVAQQRCCVGRQ